jgi:hypothetical protein
MPDPLMLPPVAVGAAAPLLRLLLPPLPRAERRVRCDLWYASQSRDEGEREIYETWVTKQAHASAIRSTHLPPPNTDSRPPTPPSASALGRMWSITTYSPSSAADDVVTTRRLHSAWPPRD